MNNQDNIMNIKDGDFNEYALLYGDRYGNSGPSMSSSCEGRNKAEKCGCWKHHLIKLRKWALSSK